MRKPIRRSSARDGIRDKPRYQTSDTSHNCHLWRFLAFLLSIWVIGDDFNGRLGLPMGKPATGKAAECLLWVNNRLMRRSKRHLYSITSSVRASSIGTRGELGDAFPLLEEHAVYKRDDRLHMLVRRCLQILR